MLIDIHWSWSGYISDLKHPYVKCHLALPYTNSTMLQEHYLFQSGLLSIPNFHLSTICGRALPHHIMFLPKLQISPFLKIFQNRPESPTSSFILERVVKKRNKNSPTMTTAVNKRNRFMKRNCFSSSPLERNVLQSFE